MQRARQRRLHPRLAVSQLCGRAASAVSTRYNVLRSGPCRSSPQPYLWLLAVFFAQGSYHCGSCKTGFTGDQVKGCKPEISCGNSLTNPCDVNAQCIPERDGSITCQVAPLYLFILFCFYTLKSFSPFYSTLGGFIVLPSVESAGLEMDTSAERIRTLTDTPMRSWNAKTPTAERCEKERFIFPSCTSDLMDLSPTSTRWEGPQKAFPEARQNLEGEPLCRSHSNPSQLDLLLLFEWKLSVTTFTLKILSIKCWQMGEWRMKSEQAGSLLILCFFIFLLNFDCLKKKKYIYTPL